MVKRTSLKGLKTGYNSFYKCHGRKPVGIYCQNNILFHPPDNFVEICKNSQTKARKRERVHGFLEYRSVFDFMF